MVIKTIVMLSLYLIPYFLIIANILPLWGMLIMSLIMGIGASGVGLSVMHDANHGAYSHSQKLNDLLGMSVNLVGGSSFTWKVQHNYLHHTFTNIYELDEDIDDKPMIRLSPYGKWSKIHRYQHIYACFLYAFATVSWILKKDFKQLFHYHREGLTEQMGFNPMRETIVLFATKIFYVLYICVVPLLVLDITFGQWLLGFLVMHAAMGLILTLIFQLAHVVEGTDHHEPTLSGKMDNTWAIHQLQTTADFARNNRFLGWFIGGLNFQVEHHLFPTICHVHYRPISEIVKKTAEEFGLPYHDQKTFFSALRSHLRTLKHFGQAKEVIA